MNVREGRWMEYLDGELEPAERAEMERRLSSDPSEAALLDEVRERRALVRRLLGRIVVATPEPAEFLARVKEEARRRTGRPTSTTGSHRNHLARAAVVALLLVGAAGAAAAVPGSPLRAWLADLGAGNGAASGPGAEAELLHGDPGDAAEVGVRVRTTAGRLTVSLDGVADRSEVRVRLVDGDRAAVYASRGSSFRTSDGRVEATVAPGPVRIEIPRNLTEAVVRVDGRIFLEKRGDRVETPGPRVPDAGDRNTDLGILFRTERR